MVTEDISAPADTPAVSARILKKRETDRKCQRMIRERTKSRISYLEGLVEQFREQDPSGRVETLMKQLTDMREERDGLVKKVKTIESIISGGNIKEEPDIPDPSGLSLRSNSIGELPLGAAGGSQRTTYESQSPLEDPASSAHETPIYTINNKQYAAYLEHSALTSSSPSAFQASPPIQTCSCECSTPMPTGGTSTLSMNRWRYTNDTLTQWFKWSPETLDMQNYFAYNDDIPVRAVVEGWDAVEQHGHMHPAWRLLRGIDENVFYPMELRERLASLQLMGWLLFAHINPTREQHMKLPPFYLKRPSKDMLHAYAIEYFAWPGLRERFVYSEHRYCSTMFWRLYTRNVHIAWPYEFRDCYNLNLDTGLYKLSPSFQDRISDIQAWTMGIDMFKQYPELYSDIPAWNHIPVSVNAISTVPRQARIPLPPPFDVSESQKKRRGSIKYGSQIQPPHQVSIRVSTAPNEQPMYQIVPRSSTTYAQSPHGSLETEASSLSTSFGYPPSDGNSTIGELQHVPGINGWSYNNNSTNLNADMYQITTSGMSAR